MNSKGRGRGRKGRERKGKKRKGKREERRREEGEESIEQPRGKGSLR